jgi:hypothetical protein
MILSISRTGGRWADPRDLHGIARGRRSSEEGRIGRPGAGDSIAGASIRTRRRPSPRGRRSLRLGAWDRSFSAFRADLKSASKHLVSCLPPIFGTAKSIPTAWERLDLSWKVQIGRSLMISQSDLRCTSDQYFTPWTPTKYLSSDLR